MVRYRLFSLGAVLVLFLAACHLVSARITHGSLPAGISASKSSSPFDYPTKVDLSGWCIVRIDADAQSRTVYARYAGAGGGVPAILIEPLSAGLAHRAPCLLLIHGLGGQKEDMVPLGRLAAQDGYASFIIDLPDSGARRPDKPRQFESARDLTDYMSDSMTKSVDDLGIGLDYLQLRPELDTRRIGVLGLSLGSFIAVDLAAFDPRIKAVMLISSGGGLADILEFQARTGVSFGRANQSVLSQADPADLERALAGVDPLTYVARIAPRPILMVNSTGDPVVPPDSARRLYAAAGRPKEIDWIDGDTHVPSPLGIYASVTVFLGNNLRAR
jgi:pimeloyl-ACP methyl ester carboxylesterase